jgi:hypothetical protein
MSHIFNQVGSAVSRMFTIGGGSTPAAAPPPMPAAPQMPQILAAPPVAQPVAPMPDPYSNAVRAARTAASQKALGAQGRASTILTTARSRSPAATIGGGSYAATTLGGT